MSDLDPDAPVPRFFWLLGCAQEASEAVDNFELDDTNLEEFDGLVKEQQRWALTLLEHFSLYKEALENGIKAL